MSKRRERLREVLADGGCTPVAPIFDALSARIAQLVGWEICKLTGSSAKAASRGVPDQLPIGNINDVVEICARIARVADVSLIVDADDGGGNALNVRRTVRELESAGVAAIELEDCLIPPTFASGANPADFLVSKDEHVGKLEAAVAAKRDDSTIIVARTRAMEFLPLDEALDRIHDYCETGVDALYLSGYLPRGRADIAAAHAVTDLPMYLLRLPSDAASDPAFLAENRVALRTMEQAVYGLAAKSIYDALQYLRQGGSPAAFEGDRASKELLLEVAGAPELEAWEQRFSADRVAAP